jgi:hypothetical protein
MRIEQFNSLTSDELEFIGVVMNSEPRFVEYEIPSTLFVSIKHSFLMNRLTSFEKSVKTEYMDLYKGIVEKLTR